MLVYRTGDAARPSRPGPAIIAHVCNDLGAWGKGFVTALSARWPQPEAAYRQWARSGIWRAEPFVLGGVQIVDIPDTPWMVANMVAQHGLGRNNRLPPIRYGALETCLHKLQNLAHFLAASIHMPRIGCGLAGGRWEKVEPLIVKILWDLDVFVYDLEPGHS